MVCTSVEPACDEKASWHEGSLCARASLTFVAVLFRYWSGHEIVICLCQETRHHMGHQVLTQDS